MTEIAPSPSAPGSRAVQLAFAGLAGALIAVAVAMWAIYGSAVFVEMILTGINACF